MHQDVQDLPSHDSKLLRSQEIPSKSSQSSEVCISGGCERLADLVDCESYVQSVLQEMSENANTCGKLLDLPHPVLAHLRHSFDAFTQSGSASVCT